MSMKYLGPSFDLHTGGEDNVFPHHECEIAQSQCHTGETFVRYWLHARHLLVDNKKMSKSLGNFFTVQDILDRGFTGLELRFALLRVHYRATMNFTLAAMADARAALERIPALPATPCADPGRRRARGGRFPCRRTGCPGRCLRRGVGGGPQHPQGPRAGVRVRVRPANRSHPPREDSGAALRLFDRWDDVLGVFGPAPSISGGSVPPDVLDMAERRQQARAEKDWGKADSLRDGLAERGFQVIDDPNAAKGYRVEPL